MSDTGEPEKSKSKVSSLETPKLTMLESGEQEKFERNKGDCESEGSKSAVEIEQNTKQTKVLKRSRSKSESADSKQTSLRVKKKEYTREASKSHFFAG